MENLRLGLVRTGLQRKVLEMALDFTANHPLPFVASRTSFLIMLWFQTRFPTLEHGAKGLSRTLVAISIDTECVLDSCANAVVRLYVCHLS